MTCPICPRPPARVDQDTIRGTEALCLPCRKAYWSARDRSGWTPAAWIAHASSPCTECGGRRATVHEDTTPWHVYLCSKCRAAARERARDRRAA
jgi:hypothetical protein